MISLLKNILLTDLGMRFQNDRLLRPVILHATTTNRCNLRCRMCNIWRQEEKVDLPEAALHNLAASPLSRGIEILDITGGEPFLTDLPKLVAAAGGERLGTVLISSNGTLTEKALATARELLERYRFNLVVDVSLDGLEDVHDRIRGVLGTFEKASRTLEGLGLLSREHPRLKPTVKMTILKENYRDILSVYEFARKTGAEFTTKPGSEFGFTGTTGDRSFDFNPAEAAEIIRQVEEVVARQRSDPLGRNTFWRRVYRQANVIFHRELIDYLRKRFIERVPCAVGRCYSSCISVLLHYDGKVYNCPTLLKPVGDLSRQSFEEIWLGEEMKKARRAMASGSCACFSQCDQMPALVLEHKRELIGGLFRRYSEKTIPRMDPQSAKR